MKWAAFAILMCMVLSCGTTREYSREADLILVSDKDFVEVTGTISFVGAGYNRHMFAIRTKEGKEYPFTLVDYFGGAHLLPHKAGKKLVLGQQIKVKYTLKANHPLHELQSALGTFLADNGKNNFEGKLVGIFIYATSYEVVHQVID